MSQRAHILIVDDDSEVRKALSELMEETYEVTAVSGGKEAISFISEQMFDVIVLDIRMPEVDGLEVLDTVKVQSPHTSVIMFSAHGTLDAAISAMRGGADNFLKKTASPETILQSIKEALAQTRQERQRDATLIRARRLLETAQQHLDLILPEQTDLPVEAVSVESPAELDRFIQKGPLLIDAYRRMVTLDGKPLDLTAGEYDLLLSLAENAPRVLDPQELVQETRGFECTLSEARELIRWQVYLLRQKVEPNPSSPQYILNVRGQGYMWAAV